MTLFLRRPSSTTHRAASFSRAVGPRLAATLLSATLIAATPFVAAAQESPPADSGDAAPSDTTLPPDTTTTTTTLAAPETTTTTTVPSTTTTTTTTTTTVPETPNTGTTTTTSTVPSATTTTTLVAPPSTEPVATTTTTLPVPATTQPTARDITVYPEQIEHILATIRYLESRGIYTLPPNKGNASGAYQFIGSTWGNYAGYAHAYLAPPAIQDERAAADVNRFLAQFDNDVSMIPVMWYLPAASRNPALMDVVPLPSAGNVLTIREYQTRWLGVFATISGQPVAPRLGPIDLSSIAGNAPELPTPHDGVPSLSYPVLGPSRVAAPECDDAAAVESVDNNSSTPTGPSRADIEAAGLCTEHAPGIVFGVKLQPVLAVADGIVTDIVDEPGTDQPITVTITDADGVSYIYAGFNDDNLGTDDGNAPDHLRLAGLAEIGNVVRAGQVIGFMGDTDPLPIGVRADVPTDATVQIDPDAVAPHIRLTMVDLAGNPIDAFGPMIDALFRQTCSVLIGPWSSDSNGSGHDETVIETTDNDDAIDSEWVITSTGQVMASGWGTLVNPSAGCGYAPSAAFGPGGSGALGGALRWLTPVDLPTDVWVALSTRDDNDAAGFLRR